MRRTGLVTLDYDLLVRDQDIALAILRDLVVWRVDENLLMNTITYWAECRHFDPVKEGEFPPEYKAEVSIPERGSPSVSWRKT